MEQKQEKLYALLNEKLDHTEEISDEEILVEIDKLIWEEAKGQYMPLSEKITLRQQLFNGIRRLDILQELLEDESVTEIMVNGPDAIFVERAGKLSRWEKTFTSGEKLEEYAAGSTVLFRKQNWKTLCSRLQENATALSMRRFRSRMPDWKTEIV